jgi:fatty-acyl-CoA synthase
MGQTETSILLWASEEESLRKPGTVGRPVFHAQVDVFNRRRQPVPPGDVGEIVARGSIMMNAYWRDPEATRETIRDGWLYTGDLAYKDDKGYFFLVDRAKDMYISGGENIYPAEVERVLRQHPEIEDVAVVGISDDTYGEVGLAYVIPKDDGKPNAEEIIAFCNGRLARYKWPKTVVFCAEFPRTSLGKVRKHILTNES